MVGNSIAANIENIYKRINKISSDVTLVAVSKFHPAEFVVAAVNAGVKNFGENYVQEALQKQNEISDLNINWHFIGNIQKNKIKQIVGKFDLIQSIDNLVIAKKVDEFANKSNIVQKILLQVNIGSENTKSGISLEGVEGFVEQITELRAIKLQGLMCLPPLEIDEDKKIIFFKAMRKKFECFKNMSILSMGTSHDYELAINEGANMVRVGTDIFGERLKR